MSKSITSSWIALAVTSGACAAFNGVFAKLTTTELTTSWSGAVAQAIGLSPTNKVFEGAFRGLFFGLNLLFNAIMWGLFTRALTLASSTVKVSVINTSANFMITALLGALVFSETLPGLWWLGAAMLVVGSVIIGRKHEESKPEVPSTAGSQPLLNDEDADRESLIHGSDDGDGEGVGLGRLRSDFRQDSSSDEDAVLKRTSRRNSSSELRAQ